MSNETKDSTPEAPSAKETLSLAMKELYFRKLKDEYPAIFANPETEREFRDAADKLVSGATRLAVGEIRENLVNFMLQNVENIEEALTRDEALRGDGERVLKEQGLAKFLSDFLRTSYIGVMDALSNIVAGTKYSDPETCDCDHHRNLAAEKAAVTAAATPRSPIPVVDAVDMTDEDMDAVISDTKGEA